MSEAPVLPYQSPGGGGVIVAKASWDYRWRRWALVLVMFGWGLWSLHDGFIKYPRENEQFTRDHPGLDHPPHPALDIPFNQWIGIALPPLSLLGFAWTLYASRGAYRYDGDTISAPGHDSVPLRAIRKIDNSKWDRKGIALLQYQIPGKAKLGVIKLDDFIYERSPTDAIYEQVYAAVAAGKTPVAADAPVRPANPSSQ